MHLSTSATLLFATSAFALSIAPRDGGAFDQFTPEIAALLDPSKAVLDGTLAPAPAPLIAAIAPIELALYGPDYINGTVSAGGNLFISNEKNFWLGSFTLTSNKTNALQVAVPVRGCGSSTPFSILISDDDSQKHGRYLNIEQFYAAYSPFQLGFIGRSDYTAPNSNKAVRSPTIYSNIYNGYDFYGQSSVWTMNCTSKVVTANWVNSDNSKSEIIFTDYAYGNYHYVYAFSRQFVNFLNSVGYYSSLFAVKTLTFVPDPSPSLLPSLPAVPAVLKSPLA